MRIPVQIELPILIGALFLTVAAVPALLAPAIVWSIRGLFGLKAGLMSGRAVIAILLLLPIWPLYQCSTEMSVPPVIVDGETIDNDADVRSLLMLGLVSIPAAIAGSFAVSLSARSFSRRLSQLSDGKTGS